MPYPCEWLIVWTGIFSSLFSLRNVPFNKRHPAYYTFLIDFHRTSTGDWCASAWHSLHPPHGAPQRGDILPPRRTKTTRDCPCWVRWRVRLGVQISNNWKLHSEHIGKYRNTENATPTLEKTVTRWRYTALGVPITNICGTDFSGYALFISTQ